ncbi:MAG TPA: DUF6010 family protein [Thermoanaerobaculia bacterium]|jgi:hypothetical protein
MNFALPPDAVQLLIGGAINGSILVLLALAAPRLTKQILFAVLVFAAVMYVVFTVGTEDASLWMLVEIAGIALYGAMGWRGLNGSPWWLVAGWVAHPVWDIALHFIGPGHTFAPVDYTIPCLTYDLAVAAIYAIRLAWPRHAIESLPVTAHQPSS